VGWQAKAKCRDADPETWYVENLPAEDPAGAATQLCAGCPVLVECAKDAVTPVDMAKLLGTFETPDLVHVSGVVRAGIIT
jgi:hypothetical protein